MIDLYSAIKIFAKKVGEDELNSDDEPCWEGYEMVGMKKDKGRSVPNCVPKSKK